MRCSNCSNKLLQKAGGRVRVRLHGPIVFDEDGLCKSKCYWCKTDVTVPLTLDCEQDIAGERFYVRKRP